MIYLCAYNFPAVLYIYGKEIWPQIKILYLKMASDKNFRVRKSIASSINEIANILGREITENELVPVFDKFYREEGEIQKTIYKAMPKFLLNVDYKKRKPYLDKLKRLTKIKEKWRSRKEYAEILGNFGGVFEDEITFEQILPICVNLCVDEVSEVRVAASKSIYSIIGHFLMHENEEYSKKCLLLLEAFALSVKYTYRQV